VSRDSRISHLAINYVSRAHVEAIPYLTFPQNRVALTPPRRAWPQFGFGTLVPYQWTTRHPAAWGLKLRGDDGRSYEVIALARWLRDTAGLLGRRAPALVAARVAFQRSLSLEDFEPAATLAGPEWTDLRAHLMASLPAAKYAHDRTEIFLGAGRSRRRCDPSTSGTPCATR
jgi:hypothetical protein